MVSHQLCQSCETDEQIVLPYLIPRAGLMAMANRTVWNWQKEAESICQHCTTTTMLLLGKRRNIYTL